MLSKKFSRANLFVNDIGNINLADRRRKNQAVCVKLCVRAGSEVAGDHEAVRDDTTFMDIKAETELGLSGQRRDIVRVVCQEMLLTLAGDHRDIDGGQSLSSILPVLLQTAPG